MEVLAIRRATVIFYFPLERTNPTGKAVAQEINAQMVQRYGFLKYPQTFDDFDYVNVGVMFGRGAWQGFDIEEVRFFHNGVLVASRTSTEHAQAFFDDMTLLLTGIGLTFSPEMILQKLYLSQIVCRFEADLKQVNPALDALVAKTFVGHEPTRLSQISFMTKGNTSLAAPIRIEQVADSPLDSREYWTQTPIQTSEHLEFLREFEQVLLTSGGASAVGA